MNYTYNQLNKVLNNIGYGGERQESNYNALRIVLDYLEVEYPDKLNYYIQKFANGRTMTDIAEELNLSRQAISYHVNFCTDKLSNPEIIKAIAEGYNGEDECPTALCSMVAKSRFGCELLPDLIDLSTVPLNIDTEFIDILFEGVYSKYEMSTMDYVIVQIILESLKRENNYINIYRRYIVDKHSIDYIAECFNATSFYIEGVIEITETELKRLYEDNWEALQLFPGATTDDINVYNMCKYAGYPVKFDGDEVEANTQYSDDNDIDLLDLSVASVNALHRAGFHYIGHLSQFIKRNGDKWYFLVTCIGKHRAKEIEAALSKFKENK